MSTMKAEKEKKFVSNDIKKQRKMGKKQKNAQQWRSRQSLFPKVLTALAGKE
jgi:hypothetical protein